MNASDLWTNEKWGHLSERLFKIQNRIYSAVREGDTAKAVALQKVLIRSRGAVLWAVKQVTQLNTGKATAGLDGMSKLTFKQRYDLADRLSEEAMGWKHGRLRSVKIPKGSGDVRILKVPNICDRAWQCLIKYALEPAHEATFHSRSYGYRPGRSAHDVQKVVFMQLRSQSNGIDKRVIELDIEKCFDRIAHKAILERLIAPTKVKQRLEQCLNAGVEPGFPGQGTPQGGVSALRSAQW